MSGGAACACREGVLKSVWVVLQRHCNHSAFAGYAQVASRYSEVYCPVCGHVWRTKAKYVDALSDGERK
jgi:hypothetical protein